MRSSVYLSAEVFCVARIKDSGYRITGHADVYSSGMLMCTLFDVKAPHFIFQDSDFNVQEIKVGNVSESKASCQDRKELCDITEKRLQFDSKYVSDCGKHGHPLLKDL